MNLSWYIRLFLLLCGITLISCNKDDSPIKTNEELMYIPAGFPEITFPVGNDFTPERWKLGKSLFYETALSKSGKVSCGSCHQAESAFSDHMALSKGDEGEIGTSNAPTLTNVAYQPYFTRAGGVATLEMQVLVPIQEHNEFNSNIVDIAEQLKINPQYSKAAFDNYDRELDPYVIVRAISTFERSLISGNSAYDKFYFQGIKSALSMNAIRGMDLFMSEKTNCSKCHQGFNFSNYAFENNGLYEVYADSGRMRLTRLEGDRALFKVPTLRNVKFTAPYMHDGSLSTLKDVINHYNSGGQQHPNKSQLIKPLGLTIQEQADLLAFLESLSDFEFINNKNFRK
jgi:cytochrome c peroxidase